VRIVAIVQARMGSARLPGKVLADIGGRPALAHVLARCAAIASIEELVLAIPTDAADDPLAEVGQRCGARVVRGDRDDVLNRYWTAAASCRADAVARITGDCPLLDPAVSSRVVRRFAEGGVDYVSNVHPPTFPDGYDTEVIALAALEAAWREATDSFEREHVTPFIWRRPDRFRLANVSETVDRSSWRLTLDTSDDLGRIRALWAELGSQPTFGLTEVAALVGQRPELLPSASVPASTK
jgi:spore coat polysaccharide biosynthesis protein SpsF (cytidylyltransferase family)